MKEALLQHIWKTGNFDHTDLVTTEGLSLSIIEKGIHNMDAGPDFKNAKIKIGNTTWAGHIEIHINTSDWKKHKHQTDKAYNNVILHVVMENDTDINNELGLTIPTLELKDRINSEHLHRHEKLMASLAWIPCQNHFHKFSQDKFPLFLESLLIKRLHRKYTRIKRLLHSTNDNWEEVLYRLILRYMGMKVNGDAFEILSEKAPHKLLLKCETLEEKECFLLGQAGMLTSKDNYISKLSKEYNHIKGKFNLEPMTGVEWKFARLRPANFPTLRIAQVASLYQNAPQLFNFSLHATSVESIFNKLNIETSAYWDTHYLPGKETKTKLKKIGQSLKDTLLINAFIPLIYAYGEFTQNQSLIEKAVDMLGMIKTENNSIIRKWKEMNVLPQSAVQSQALIDLKTNLCDKHKCLSCPIGQSIIFDNKERA